MSFCTPASPLVSFSRSVVAPMPEGSVIAWFAPACTFVISPLPKPTSTPLVVYPLA